MQAVRRIEILGDDKTSLTLIRNLESQKRVKYIDIIHYYIQRLIEDK